MSDSRIAEMLQAGVSAFDSASGGERAGDMIGCYRLLEPVGEGGFGLVWRAEQKEPVRREAALKIIKPGMDSREITSRFEAERQALALMDHPNIARMFEGGTTATGRLYFAMEFVKGEPITLFCDERQLGLEARIRLFMDVCAAVQHAHQKGIIHRDLKPSNILVIDRNDEFVPKVIDFGIAKALGQKLTANTMFTLAGMAVGTPQYMSPEQAGLRNQDVDTRSDVYSLGVILYELLTGTTPLTREALRQMGLGDLQQWIREKEPERPSARIQKLDDDTKTRLAKHHKVDATKLQRSLRGDLDWIVMRALEKDRSRRYQTANALALDLRRYLDGEPVEAGPPSRLYRLGKVVRKNRTAFAAVVAVVLALVAGLGVAAWRYSEEAKARVLADQSEAEAQSERQKSDALLKKTQLERAEEFFVKGDASSGIAYLASVLRRDPADRITASRVLSALRDRSHMRMIAGPWTGDGIIGWEPDDDGLLIQKNGSIIRWKPGQSQPDPTPLFSFEDNKREGLVGYADTWQPVLSPNGSQLLRFHDWGICRLYDWPSGKPSGPLLKIEGAYAGFNTQESSGFIAAFSPDGQSVATVMAASRLCVWDAKSGSRLDEIHPGKNGNPTYAAFSADGKWLAVGTRNGTVELRETEGEKWPLRQQWHVGDGHIRKLTFSGDRLLVQNHDHDLLLIRVQDGKAAAQPVLLGVALNYDVSDADDLVAAATRNRIELISLKTEKPVMPAFDTHEYANEVSISKDGRRLLVMTESSLQVWSLGGAEMINVTRRFPSSFSGDAFGVRPNAQFSPDGRFVAVRQADGSISIWQTSTTRSLPLCYPLEGQKSLVDLHQDGERLAVASASHAAVAKLSTGHLESPVMHASYQVPGLGLYSLAFEPHSKRLWVGLAGPSRPTNNVQSWDWPSGQKAGHGLPLVGYAFVLSFDQSGRHLYVMGNTSHVYDSPGLMERQGGWTATNVTGFGGYSHLAADGRTLLQHHRDGSGMTRWDISTGQPDSPVFATEASVSNFFPTPSNEFCVASHPDGSARVWDAHTGKPAGPAVRHKASVYDASLHLPSDVMATASADHTARLWRISTGEPLGAVMRHHESVYQSQLSPDGKRAATSSYDGTVRVWDVSSGRPLTEAMPVMAGLAENCLWHPDGTRLITSGRSPAQCWDVPVVGESAPPWLADWAEAVGGYKLDEHSELVALPLDADRRFRDKSDAPPPKEIYAKTLRWFYESLSTRAISPNAQITRGALTALFCRVEDKAGLALDLAPDEPLPWVCLLWTSIKKQETLPATLSPVLNRLVGEAKQDPGRAAAAWFLDGMLASASKPERAALCCREALKLGLDNSWKPRCQSLLADLLLKAEQWDDAAIVLGQALGPITPGDQTNATRGRWVAQRRMALLKLDDQKALAADNTALLGLPARAPGTPPELMNLAAYYNKRLDEGLIGSNQSFKEMSAGTGTFAGVSFDVRGLILLRCRDKDVTGSNNVVRKADPENSLSVVGIPIDSVCRRLHFLHCSISTYVSWGSEIGAYLIHYADGQEARVPLNQGRELQDRHRTGRKELNGELPPPHPSRHIAWKGHDEWSRKTPMAHTCTDLFTWENPRPDVPVKSVDIVSNANDAGLCVFGITRE